MVGNVCECCQLLAARFKSGSLHQRTGLLQAACVPVAQQAAPCVKSRPMCQVLDSSTTILMDPVYCEAYVTYAISPIAYEVNIQRTF